MELLESGIERLGLEASEDQILGLRAYAALLLKWNRVYNLTAIENEEDVVIKHLLDSLTVLPYFKKVFGSNEASLLDVGAGAGLPSVPIAIMEPGWRVCAVDKVQKKCVFMRQAGATLRLGNFKVLHSRVEDLKGTYGIITSRAFSSLSDFVGITEKMLSEDGSWMAMKGRYPEDEIKALPLQIEVRAVYKLSVPFLASERHLVEMVRKK